MLMQLSAADVSVLVGRLSNCSKSVKRAYISVPIIHKSVIIHPYPIVCERASVLVSNLVNVGSVVSPHCVKVDELSSPWKCTAPTRSEIRTWTL